MADLQTGSEYINNVLVDKGFLRQQESLDFTQGSKKNNARIINTIYALLNSLESRFEEREKSDQELKELKKRCAMLEYEKESLENRIAGLTKRLDGSDREKATMQDTAKRQYSQIAALRSQLRREKATIDQDRNQFVTEMRKRDVEIDRLMARLRDDPSSKRGRPDYARISGSLTRSSTPRVTNGNRMIQPQVDSAAGTVDYDAQHESSDIVSQLSDLASANLHRCNDVLAEENKNMWHSLDRIRAGLHRVMSNGNKMQTRVTGLECFSIIDDAQGDSYNGVAEKDSIKDHCTRVLTRVDSYDQLVEEFEAAFDQLIELLNSPNYVSVSEVQDKEREITSLKEQLRATTQNWERAMKTMEQWKDYRESRKSNERKFADENTSPIMVESKCANNNDVPKAKSAPVLAPAASPVTNAKHARSPTTTPNPRAKPPRPSPRSAALTQIFRTNT